jgi:ParB family transcriptional regulator, chromosome partitioning protein
MKTSEKNKLGRGLSALIGDLGIDQNMQRDNTKALLEVALEDLVANKEQPRKNFDAEALKELSDSIKQKGVISPIIVRKNSDGKYEIIAGERRFRAAGFANLKRVPVIIKDIEETAAFEIALIENLQRQDLNVIEEANAYKSLMEKHSYNQNEISEVIGKSRSHITNILRLLTLPPKVLELLMYDAISMGHARALIGMPNAEAMAKRVVEQGLSVRQTEFLVNRKRKPKTQILNLATSDNIKNDIKLIEELLSQKLHTTVAIKAKDENAGSISVKYKSLEELDKILQLLSKS